MATTKKITMKQFNGTDYDTLYPKTIASQITGTVPIASGGTNGTSAPSGVNNLVAGLSQITPASNDLFPFRDVSGNTGGSVTLANLATALGNNGVITPSNLAEQSSALGFAKIQTGSYVGTGTYGEDNPCSLTFNFAPKIVLFTDVVRLSDGMVYTSSISSNPTENLIIHSLDMLTTTYVQSAGFGQYGTTAVYGRKSSNGKTIYWYSTSNALRQFNDTDYRYYWVAIN